MIVLVLVVTSSKAWLGMIPVFDVWLTWLFKMRLVSATHNKYWLGREAAHVSVSELRHDQTSCKSIQMTTESFGTQICCH